MKVTAALCARITFRGASVMDKRYGLVEDHLEQAAIILKTIPGRPIELLNILSHTRLILQSFTRSPDDRDNVVRLEAHRRFLED